MAASLRVKRPSSPGTWLVFAAAAAIGLGAGRLLAQSGSAIPLPLLGLAGLAGGLAMFMVGPGRLFVSWLLLAPLLGNSADDSSVGYALRWSLYLAPALIFIPMTLLDWRQMRVRWFDLLPGAFVVYVFVVMVMTSDLLRTDTVGTAKAFFQIVAVGAIVYYFLVFGPGRAIDTTRICWALLVGVIIQALLTFVEARTSWNLWNDSSWRRIASRPVSTLANPGVLGMFLGVGVVVGLAVLAWNGPQSLRRLSIAAVALGVPAVALTLTRGSMLPTVLVGCVIVLTSRRWRLAGLAAVALSVVALVALWPTITSSQVYQDRLADRTNVQGRFLLQDWSLRLAAEKPFTGWGYDSFDRVKNASDFSTHGLPPSFVLESTSHDSYLTVLVEYGSVGFLLLMLPWVVLVIAGIRAVPLHPDEQWVLVASLGALTVVLLTGATLDYRFFSFALMLPWIFLGTIRRVVER
jgi:O-antigen ligase